MKISLDIDNYEELIKIKQRLESPEFIDFIKSRLANELKDSNISQPRIRMPNVFDELDYIDSEYIDEFLNEDGEASFYKQLLNQIQNTHIKNKQKTVVALNHGEDKKTEVKAVFDYNSFCPIEKNHCFTEENQITFFHNGVIAGGSLAALANEFINGTPAIINDVDYFYYTHSKHKTSLSLKEELYEKSFESSKHFKILSSHKNKRLNSIRIKPNINFNEGNFFWSFLLSSFDLNCTKIAFNPFFESFYISFDFLNFLFTKRIEISTENEFCLTNIIRGKRKANELKADFYLGDNVRKLLIYDFERSGVAKTAEHSAFAYNKTSKSEPFFISKKDVPTLENDNNFLMPYVSYDNNKLKIKHTFPLIKSLNKIKEIYPERDENRYALKTLKNISKITKNNFLENEASNTFYERMESALLLFSRTNKLYNLDYTQVPFPYSLLKENVRYFQVERFLKKISNHTSLVKVVLNLMDDNHSFLETSKFVSKVIKEGSLAIAVLEQALGIFAYRCSKSFIFEFKNNPQIEIKSSDPLSTTFDNILKVLNTRKLERQLLNILKEKEDLRYFNKYVKELTTMDELELEGKKMKHCVGGFDHSVRSGRNRIFHLNIEENHSTIQISIDSNCRIVQNKSYCNAIPHPSLIRLGELLNNFINKEEKKKTQAKETVLTI